MTEFQYLNRLPISAKINVVSFLDNCIFRTGKLIGRIMLNDPRYEIQITHPQTNSFYKEDKYTYKMIYINHKRTVLVIINLNIGYPLILTRIYNYNNNISFGHIDYVSYDNSVYKIKK